MISGSSNGRTYSVLVNPGSEAYNRLFQKLVPETQTLSFGVLCPSKLCDRTEMDEVAIPEEYEKGAVDLREKDTTSSTIEPKTTSPSEFQPTNFRTTSKDDGRKTRAHESRNSTPTKDSETVYIKSIHIGNKTTNIFWR